MDAVVLYKRGKRTRTGGASLLGNGMLERARATSLALLGATAAVGLAIVALALNQGWPLIAGSSIPQLRQEVGRATVAARPEPRRPGRPAPLRRHRAGGAPASPADDTSAGVVSGPDRSTESVVYPSAPADPGGGDSQPAHQSPAPAPSQPVQQSPASPAPPTAEPVSSPQPPAPVTTPVSTTPPSTPPATTSAEAPPEEESNVPPWSHGGGHAWGRSEEWGGHGSSEHDDDGCDDDGHGSHGHHWDSY